MSRISGMPILVGHDQFSVLCCSSAISEKSIPVPTAVGDKGLCALQHWAERLKRPEPLRGHDAVGSIPFPLSTCVTQICFYMNIIWEEHVFSGLK